jgi:GNAT superfamily N-acetyltransferase
MSRVTRVLEKLREVGIRYAVQIALARFLPVGWFRAGSLVVFALDPAAARLAPLGDAGLVLRWASRGDAELLAGFGHSRATLEERLSRGDRAFVMYRESELLGYVWFCGGVYEDDGLGIRFRMRPAEVWLYDAMIARGQRGRGLYAALLNAATGSLAREGVARVWIAVEAHNRNSVEAHIRGGAIPLCTLRLVRLFGVSRLGGAALPDIPRYRVGGWPEIPSSALPRAG